MQQMGRFTLRDENKTIGVGKVLRYIPYNKAASGTKTATPPKKAESNQIDSSTKPVKGIEVTNVDGDDGNENVLTTGATSDGTDEENA